MKIPDKMYNALKWILGVAFAPTIALITGLSQIYGWDVTTLIQTLSLVATFLGAIFGISVATYKKIDTDTEA